VEKIFNGKNVEDYLIQNPILGYKFCEKFLGQQFENECH
jgi:hypothetical protein